MRQPVFLFLILTTCLPTLQAQQEPPVPPVHVVLFTPAGVEPPEGAEERLAAAAEYAEAFLVDGMKHWKYNPAREQFLERDENGRVKVLHVQGSKPATAEEYKSSKLLPELWKAAHEKYGLAKVFPIWWIWVYLGETEAFTDYRGSGVLKTGGWAIVRYISSPGAIEAFGEVELAEDFLHTFTLKACIHELGHAFGLPHIGPRVKDQAGNSLMGPRTDPYRKLTRSEETRVYLDEASAAMLWKHPVFSGSAQDRGVIPSMEVTGLKLQYNPRTNDLRLTGQLRSNGQAHSVVVMDEVPPSQTDYWRKAYVGKLQEHGRFTVKISEPAQASGSLRLLFCFENGAVTGDGKTFGLEKVPAHAYRFQRGQYSLAP